MFGDTNVLSNKKLLVRWLGVLVGALFRFDLNLGLPTISDARHSDVAGKAIPHESHARIYQ